MIKKKKSQQTRNREEIFQQNSTKVLQLTSYLRVKKMEIYPITTGNKARISSFPTLIQHNIGIPSHCNKSMEKKSYKLGNEK